MPKKVKVSPLVDLLDRFESIKARCQRIEEISRGFAFIPETTITIDDIELRYEQDLVVPKRLGLIDLAAKIQILERFVDDLEALHKRRFVHGDIR